MGKKIQLQQPRHVVSAAVGEFRKVLHMKRMVPCLNQEVLRMLGGRRGCRYP
jgi:hypothetical protein